MSQDLERKYNEKLEQIEDEHEQEVKEMERKNNEIIAQLKVENEKRNEDNIKEGNK